MSHSVRQGQGYKLNSNADRLRTKPDERVESKDSGEVVSSDNREVHVYSEHPDDVAVHYEDSDESEVLLRQTNWADIACKFQTVGRVLRVTLSQLMLECLK